MRVAHTHRHNANVTCPGKWAVFPAFVICHQQNSFQMVICEVHMSIAHVNFMTKALEKQGNLVMLSVVQLNLRALVQFLAMAAAKNSCLLRYRCMLKKHGWLKLI